MTCQECIVADDLMERQKIHTLYYINFSLSTPSNLDVSHDYQFKVLSDTQSRSCFLLYVANQVEVLIEPQCETLTKVARLQRQNPDHEQQQGCHDHLDHLDVMLDRYTPYN